MKKFDNIFVNSLDIQPDDEFFNEEEINNRIRKIAEKNNLQAGDSVNADVVYNYEGKQIESIATIEYDGEQLTAVAGYHAKKFDEGIYEEDFQA